MRDKLQLRHYLSVCVQLYDKGNKMNQETARLQVIDIVRSAGYDGFQTLVRALARNKQEGLAKQLDEDLAVLSMSLPFIFFLLSCLQH